MLFRILADLCVLLHLTFVAFALGGALLIPRWPRIAWLHVPCALWGALVEFAGWTCPLTPLENHLRALAGQARYHGGFIAHYLLPALYPANLTRLVEVLLGVVVVAVNVFGYGRWLSRRAPGPRP